MTSDGSLSYSDRLLLASLRPPLSKPVAQRAVQKAVRLLSLAQSLGKIREAADPLLRTYAFGREQSVHARILADTVDILGSRLDKLPERKRPHYTPHQRWRILEIRRLLALSAEETATFFRVSTGTVLRWETEAGREPDKGTVGSLLRPTPPLRRYADVVRHLVQTMDRLGFKGAGTVAATLARAGWRLARETVRRYQHEPPVEPPSRVQRISRPDRTPVSARGPNDVWLLDLTSVKGLFGLQGFRIAAVLDAFSRAPLAVRVFAGEPTAPDVVALFESAVRRHGRPRHVVSDQGTQFAAELFAQALERCGVRQRFGAVGHKGSVALIERFWRTLKEALRLPLFRPLTQADLQRRVVFAVLHYTFYRPHQGLARATPAEVLFGWPAAVSAAVAPPRGRLRDPSATAQRFAVAFLDPEARHPILVKAA
jgi:putative transposase